MTQPSDHRRDPPSPPTGERRAAILAIGALAAALLPFNVSAAAEAAVRIPPLADAPAASAPAATETAVFGGGCFWGVQAVFQHTRGVLQAVSGYAGGSQATARYSLIGSGMTGHAEVVQVTFDPKQVSYAQLLQIFFSVVHDPTQLNRQGPDRGTQYRSALFNADAAQKQLAQRYIAQLDGAKVFPAKIVTKIEPLVAFYPAEDEHQDYATRHPESRYIATFDAPKIANLKAMHAAWYRAEPMLVAPGAAKRR